MSEFKKVENSHFVCIEKTDADDYETTKVRVKVCGETLYVKVINKNHLDKTRDIAVAELTRKDVEAMLALFDN